jgi:hypothetical protein
VSLPPHSPSPRLPDKTKLTDGVLLIYSESFIQQYFPRMMSKAVQLGTAPAPAPASRGLPAPESQGRDDGEGRAAAPPPAYEALPRGGRTYGYTSLLD